ncbi:MAG: iron-containing alcohol dehydrogenase [Dehalococcoidia bacterium]|nr:iron-containing alcohol dehydrogenase [Dehalococcoidia bacterium]
MREETSLLGQFQFLPMEKVVFGAGSLASLPQEVDRLGCRRAMVVTGATLTKLGLARRIEEALGERWAGTFSGSRQHAPSHTVFEAIREARASGADIIISFGGGSPIDTGKIVARYVTAEIHSPRDLINLAPGDMTGNTHVALPQIAIPTTLSAAEFNAAAGITDEETRVKSVFRDHQMTPRTVILDPELTLATSAQLWASTGIKALDHAVEVIYSRHHQPLTDVTGLEAIRLLFNYLPRVMREPDDLEARLQCQIAAWFSILGVTNVRLGLGHAVGHQIGARCNVPHGLTSCVTLPHVMRFVTPLATPRLVLMTQAMGVDTGGLSAEAAAAAAADAVEAIIGNLGLPRRLRDVGVTKDDLHAVAKASFPEAASSNSPRPVTSPEEILQLLLQAW